MAQQLDEDLVQFDECDVLAEALEASVAEDQLVVALHPQQLLGVGRQPPFGSEGRGVGAEDGGVVVDSDCAVAVCRG